MAKKPSKKSAPKTSKKSPGKLRRGISNFVAKIKKNRAARIRLHRSFKRSYREDYNRKTEVPGLLAHSVKTFQIIFKHFKTFLPLILVIVLSNIVLVGLMSEETYTQFQETLSETQEQLAEGDIGTVAKSGLLLLSTVTTGGLSQGMSEVQQVFAILLFSITWLVTIYLLRHFLAGQKPKMRDGLYNALAPLISSVVIVFVIFLQSIPIIMVIITYAAAVATEFLTTPFYALIYFIFASLMIILSLYLLSSSIIALVAVSAPGLYPLAALNTASDLMAGRRIKFIIRLIYLVISLAFVWVIVMVPLIAIDLFLKSKIGWLEGIPVVSVELLTMTCFSAVYITTYIYLYYRRMLDYDEE